MEMETNSDSTPRMSTGLAERDYKFEISILGISTILREKKGFGIYLEIAGYIP